MDHTNDVWNLKIASLAYIEQFQKLIFLVKLVVTK